MIPWFNNPRIEVKSSRQADADLPKKPYEPEFGKECFYGPATPIQNRHPLSGWFIVKNGMRPRALDTRNSLDVADATQSGKWTDTVDLRI